MTTINIYKGATNDTTGTKLYNTLTNIGIGTIKNLTINETNTNNQGVITNIANLCNNRALNLQRLNFNLNISNVTNAAYAFDNCINLVTLNLQNCDSTNSINYDHMFFNCHNLVTINNISSLSTNKLNDVNSTNRMFYNCSNLNDINDLCLDGSAAIRILFIL